MSSFIPIEFAKFGEANRLAHSAVEATELIFAGWTMVGEGSPLPGPVVSPVVQEALDDLEEEIKGGAPEAGDTMAELYDLIVAAGGGGGGPIDADDITDATTVGKAIIRAADAASALSAIGAITEAQAQALVDAAITALKGTAPGILDTLGEIADAINDDANLYTTIMAAVNGKQPSNAQLTALAALTPANDQTLQYIGGSLAWRSTAQVKTTLGLSNVTDTSDTQKVASGPIKDALDGKVSLTSAGRDALALADYSELRPFYAALAKRNNARVDIAVIGASTAEGWGVPFAKNFEQRLAAILNARLPTEGLTTHGRGYIGVPTTVVNTAGGWPQTYTGGGVLDDGAFHIGPKHACYYNNGTAAVVQALAAPITSGIIQVQASPAGHATGGYYKIDGGSAVTFSTYNATSIVRNIAIGAATTSVEVGWQVGGYWIFLGIWEMAGDENKGIQVHNFGHSGYKMSQWAVDGGVAGDQDSHDAIASVSPDLIIMPDSGINDGSTGGSGVSAATYKTNLLAFIAKLRGAGSTCPILLVSMWDVTNANPLVDPWSSYVTAMREVAAADSTIVFFDAGARIPASGPTDTYGLFHADKVHTNAGGDALQMLADTVATAVLPR